MLEARGLGRRGALHPVDLEVRAGEVLGLGGLLGSGRTELARLLFGLDRADSGQMRVAGAEVDLRHPADAVASGFALCPEERKTEGIIAGLSVRENIVLALQARGGWWRTLPRERQQALAHEFVQRLGHQGRATSRSPLGALSGGNQQKVVLARWLATAPRLLILDEPTRGIDIAARQEIMEQILQLARQGMAVLFISAELEELARLCDRIVVLRDRRKVGELPAGSDGSAGDGYDRWAVMMRRYRFGLLIVLRGLCSTPARAADHVDITWMSITNLYLDFGKTRIVADGYITRLPQALFFGGGGGLAQTSRAAVPDEAAVRAVFDAIGGRPAVNLLITGHSHFDHSFDTPVWARLSGAPHHGLCHHLPAGAGSEDSCRALPRGPGRRADCAGRRRDDVCRPLEPQRRLREESRAA